MKKNAKRKPPKPTNPLATPASLCSLAAIGGLLTLAFFTQPPAPRPEARKVKVELTLEQVRRLNAMFERAAREDRAERAILQPPALTDYRSMAREAAHAEGIDPELLHTLIEAESSGCKRNRSKAGALGCTQLMPGTAKELGVDPHDPRQNIRGGAIYLKRMISRYRDETLGLVAYNFGPANTDRWLARGGRWASLPKETSDYVAKIKVRAAVARRETQLAME